MDDGDSWCFDTESSARYQVNSSAFPDGSLFSQGFLSERSENPTTPCESDNSGELERSLDEALAADDDDPIPGLSLEQDQLETPDLEGSASHKAAPPVGPRQVATDVPSNHEPQHAPRVNEVAFDIWMRQKRACTLRFPWERNVAAKVFGYKEPRSLDLPQIGCNVALAASATSSEVETPTLDSSFAKKRLRLSSMIQSEDQVRWEALRKFKVMLTINPGNSFLGSTLAEKALLLRHEAEISSSFSDAFSGKSTGTLTQKSFLMLALCYMDHPTGTRRSPCSRGTRVLCLHELSARSRSSNHCNNLHRVLDIFVLHGRTEDSATWYGSLATCAWCRQGHVCF